MNYQKATLCLVLAAAKFLDLKIMGNAQYE